MSRSEQPAVSQSERESLKAAEAAREKQWKAPSFLKELFLGNFRLDLIDPFRAAARAARRGVWIALRGGQYEGLG